MTETDDSFFHDVCERMLSVVPDDTPPPEPDPHEERRKRISRAVSIGIPQRCAEVACSADALVATRATETLTHDRGIVVLSGPRGVGKTLAASAWLLDVRRPHEAPPSLSADYAAFSPLDEHPNSRPTDDRLVVYQRTEPRLFLDAPTFARSGRYDKDETRRVDYASALVLDDLGMEYDDKSGYFRSAVDALINARYASNLPTVITTNLPAKQFRDRYGERVADRIRESGRFVALAGESMRRKS